MFRLLEIRQPHIPLISFLPSWVEAGGRRVRKVKAAFPGGFDSVTSSHTANFL
jgi:hypothetical protein